MKALDLVFEHISDLVDSDRVSLSHQINDTDMIIGSWLLADPAGIDKVRRLAAGLVELTEQTKDKND